MIVAFDDGRVIEIGTHDDLVAKDGVYSNLLKTQLSNKSDIGSDDKENAKEKLSEKNSISKTIFIFFISLSFNFK